MDVKIDPYRLLSDELSYELMIRGIVTSGTVAEKRLRLRNRMRSEQDDDFDCPLDPTAELDICNRKLRDLKQAIDNFDIENYLNDYARISTRLMHIYKRLGRVIDPTVQEDRNTLISKCEVYLKEIRFKFTVQASGHLLAEQEATETNETDDITTEPTPPPVDTRAEDPVPPTEPIEVRLAKALEQISCNLSCVPARVNAPKVPFPVHKWNVTYDGGSSLSNFLERIDELSSARGVNKQQLFSSAVEFFSGNALTWFRANRDSIHSWDDLVAALKNTFLPADYDFSLWNEIRNRTQGSEEKVSIFVANMEGLFKRLSTRPTEAERIVYIRRNLQPYLQQRLGLQTIQTVSELSQICRQLEDIQHRTQQFREPPAVSQAIEPDLAYHRPRPATRIAAVDAESDHIEAVGPSTRTPIKCWNCGQPGHRSANCPDVRRTHCYRCGKPNVTTRNCPKCAGNGQARH